LENTIVSVLLVNVLAFFGPESGRENAALLSITFWTPIF